MNNYLSICIKMFNINDIIELSRRAQELDGEVFVKRGCYCVSASSIMGLYSIDMSQGVTIEYPAKEVDFAEYLQRFENLDEI